LEEELKATLEVKKSMQTQHLQAQMRFSTAQRELEKALRELIEQRTGNARDLQVCRERERERGVTETETVLVQHTKRLPNVAFCDQIPPSLSFCVNTVSTNTV
jgi:hypothetical protein